MTLTETTSRPSATSKNRRSVLEASFASQNGDPGVAVCALVLDDKSPGRRDLGRLGLLDDAKGVVIEPPAANQRGERRPRKVLPIGRVEKGKREGAAGRRLAELRRVGAPDPRDAAQRQRLDIGAQQRPCLRAAIDERAERAPRDKASIASAPDPANRSSTRAPSIRPG